MKKSNFQIILMSIFGFFILLGLVVFASYKARSTQNSSVEVSIWGTISKDTFDVFVGKLKVDLGKDIKAKYVEKDATTFDKDLVEAIASGNGPDIVLLPQNLIVRYSDKVYNIPFTTLPERTFMDTFIQEGELYINPSGISAIPFFVDPLVMYWNRDLFSGAGVAKPPSKWSEVPLLAGKLSQSDNNANILKSAVAFGSYGNIDNAKAVVSTLIMQAGSSIVGYSSGKLQSTLGTDNQNSVATLPAENALRFFTDYSNPKKEVYSWNRSLPSSKLAFLSGDLAMYFGKASEYSDIKLKNPNLNFDVAVVPQIVGAKNLVTFGDMYGFAILKNSPNILSAYNTITSLIDADSVSTFLSMNDYAPARRDVVSNGTSDPSKYVFYYSALISRGWLDPNSIKTDTIFSDLIDNITTGRLQINDAVKKASQQINNLL